MKEFNLTKLQSYKGSVLKELKAPDSYRSYAASCRKVIKLYLRIHQDQVFMDDLVSSIKDAASALRYIGVSTFMDKAPQNLLEYLEEISTFNARRWLEFKTNLTLGEGTQVIIEESRERKQGTHCSLCRVSLSFPSYVVHRSESEVLHRSREIGIKCLRSQQGKLKAFLDTPQISSVLREIKQGLVTV